MAKDSTGAELVQRSHYLDQLRAQFHTPDIKVLVGIRRCGKSSILSMFAESLIEQQGVDPRNILFKRLDDYDVPLDYSAKDLAQEIDAAIHASDQNEWFHVFLDEIQDVEGWENVIRRLHTRPKTDVYITGSNARVLSGELATQLTGRYYEIPIYPLSFGEYLTFPALKTETTDQETRFSDYLRFGGMPGLFALRDRSDRSLANELRGIYQSILFKDVAQRFEIRDLTMLEHVGRYLCSTSGTLFSSRKIANTLTSMGTKASTSTIDNIVGAIGQAYLLYSAEQTGLQGKALLRPKRKFYPADTGFRNLMTGFTGTDLGAQLECVIFRELLMRGYTVTVGTFDNLEIDFVARRGGDKLYVQVTLSMLEEQTRQRELRPLEQLTDAFPRMVITLDRFSAGITEQGIRIVNAIDWLLGK